MGDFNEYFVIHAPRQTGKATVLDALARDINEAGQRVALVFSCEQAAPAGDNYGAAIDALLATITDEAYAHGLAPEQMPPSPWPDGPPEVRLRRGLTTWSRSCPLPIVLLIDEIDTLTRLSLIAVLRQLKTGYLVIFDRRPEEVCGYPLAAISGVTSPAGRHVTLLRA